MSEGNKYLSRARTLPEEIRSYLAADVSDPVVAYLVGLIDKNRYGLLQSVHFHMAGVFGGRKSFIPCEHIQEVRRSPGKTARSGWMQVTFNTAIMIPVRYKILGFHPGKILVSRKVTFEEYRVSQIRIPLVRSKSREPIIIRDVVLWGLIHGDIMMDLHWLLEALLLKQIDDTWVIGLALFRYQGVPYVAAIGYGKAGRGRSGLLDIEKNKVCFPASAEQKAIGRHLRRRVNHLLARRGIRALQPPDKVLP